MTTTTTGWTTSADIPPAPWAAAVSDIRRILDVVVATGAKVTSPDGLAGPVLDDNDIGFMVQAAAPAPPLTVQFTRVAGTGTVVTNSPVTGGLVLAALNRTSHYWRSLLTFGTDADTMTRAVATSLVEGLFGAADRALAGARPLTELDRYGNVATTALSRVAATVDDTRPLTDHLTLLVSELTAERNGAATALKLLAPPPAPAPAPVAVP